MENYCPYWGVVTGGREGVRGDKSGKEIKRTGKALLFLLRKGE